MDVYCTTCGEPWDHYHLKSHVVHETDLSAIDIERWKKLPVNDRLLPHYRAKFKAVGYEFSKTMMHVIRCPGCPKNAQPDPDRLRTKQLFEDIYGDDYDGIVITFNEHHL